MAEKVQNKMGIKSIPSLLWKMGLPMVISMILQSVYNIVDTAFVINMGEEGYNGNLALTYAFPVQIFIIAVGVGTGIGINALLSQSLGRGDGESVNRIAGNGIFLAFCIYAAFLIFGIFGSRAFIQMQALGNEQAVDMGADYLTICCCFSFGSVGYTVYERFLQATGKTLYSTVSQISGALANIILDYVFIYPLGMGVAGAAWATVIGQILSLIVAMAFHYGLNKEIGSHIKYLKPSAKIIGGIYSVGIAAAVMQALLSVMMLGVNLILGTASTDAALLQGSFGVYYKIMQFALFAAFGISNTIITVLSFNYGMKSKSRVKDCIKFGLIISVTVAAAITLLFEALANPLSQLFGLAGGTSESEITEVVVTAVRIGSTGYIFMAISVGIQGVFQGFRLSCRPLIISFLRLAVIVFPLCWLFTLSPDAADIVWWAFPITEAITSVVSLLMLRGVIKKFVLPMEEPEYKGQGKLIVAVHRGHCSNGGV